MTPDDFLRSITPGIKQPEGKACTYQLVSIYATLNIVENSLSLFQKIKKGEKKSVFDECVYFVQWEGHFVDNANWS